MALHWRIIIGLVLGILWALGAVIFGLQEFTIDFIFPFGQVFINLLKLIAIPLVLFSIIKGIGDLKDINQLGSLGIKTVALYLGSTVIAIIVGLVLVNVFQPGKILGEELRTVNRLSYELWVAETDGVQIKDGKQYLGDPTYEGYLSEADEGLKKLQENSTAVEKSESATQRKEQGPLQIIIDLVPSNIFLALSSNGLMLQIIFFALFFGATLLLIPADKSRPVAKLVDSMNEVFLKMVDIVMKGAPFFVFALMAGKLVEMAGEDLSRVQDLLIALAYYSVIVVGGLGFMIFIFYPAVAVFLIKRISYFGFFRAMRKAQLLAFSTSSSAATLPVTMECVEENLKVPKKVSSFVLPIGATVNMDGTSLYISIAVVFLAQLHLVDLSIVQQITIVLTATLASIGASAVPSAGLIMMIMVLQSVGLNPMWISIIFPVDRILDMCRTVVNVTGDATVASLVASSSKEFDAEN